ncbi:MAG: OmpA family protein [Tepidimonas sp.]|uniref:OmpA family protein n=1 Tax=Tepidimonas sp. TaxID=2002775 RepID=UPI0040551FC1
MNERQLNEAQGRALETARATPTPAAAPAPTPPHPGLLHKGRYQRWHADPDPPPEEEAWLVTYLDVVTLLLVMLVVMLAFSEPITRKPPLGRPDAQGQAPMAAGQMLPAGGGSIVPPLGLPSATPGPGAQPAEQRQPDATEPRPGAETPAAEPTGPTLPPLGDLGQDIQVLVRDEGVSFRIPSEVLFASGEAVLTPAGQAIIDRLLPAFNRVPDYTIVVEGHTDNIPIQTARFPSNWELAAARASSVVRQLEARGLNPTRLRATSYADTRPLASNDTPQGRALNRRVEITLEPPQRLRN